MQASQTLTPIDPTQQLNASTRTLTITLTPENAEALKDYEFWTGKSPEDILNMAFPEFMEYRGESDLWDIAYDPRSRAAAFKRNNLNAKQIARWNAGINGKIEEDRKEHERHTLKLARKMSPEMRERFFRHTSPEEKARYYAKLASSDNRKHRIDDIRARALGVKLD
jgi:hypothetical protein